jgi:hypothetical protein
MQGTYFNVSFPRCGMMLPPLNSPGSISFKSIGGGENEDGAYGFEVEGVAVIGVELGKWKRV